MVFKVEITILFDLIESNKISVYLYSQSKVGCTAGSGGIVPMMPIMISNQSDNTVFSHGTGNIHPLIAGSHPCESSLFH